MFEKRNKQYYPYKTDLHTTTKNGKKYFLLPLKFEYKGRFYRAEPFYAELGLTVVETDKNLFDCLVEIPKGWEIYEEASYRYWSVLCNEKDEVIIGMFYKISTWDTDFFARLDVDEDLVFSKDIVDKLETMR